MASQQAVKLRKYAYKTAIQNYHFGSNLQIPREFTHTKRPSHKHCEGEIRKKLEKIHEKPATDQRAQNATPVEETPPRPQNATPVEETLRKRLNATPVEETHQRAQNATPVEETRCKRSNATPVEETLPGYSEDDFCRRNHTCVLRIRALSHKLYLSFQKAKCSRNRIGNEHRVCNHCFTLRNTTEILQGMNIGFVTNALPAKYNRNRKGNEHRVCNQ